MLVKPDAKFKQSGNRTILAFYSADVLSHTDYYAFGGAKVDRTGADVNYRYGFNGVEKDNEIKGDGNSYNTDFRMYDPRVGRWLSIDPIVHPWESPYVGFANNPIYYTDPSGLSVNPVPTGQTATTEQQNNATAKSSEILSVKSKKPVARVFVYSSHAVDPEQKDYYDPIIAEGYKNALEAAKQNSEIKIVLADFKTDTKSGWGIDDATDKIEQLGKNYDIDFLYFFGHGLYQSNGSGELTGDYSFELMKGNDIGEEDLDDMKPQLKRIGDATNKKAQIVFGACFMGSQNAKGDAPFIGKFANYTDRTVIGSRSWVGSEEGTGNLLGGFPTYRDIKAGYYPYEKFKYQYDNAGWWTEAHPDKTKPKGYRIELGFKHTVITPKGNYTSKMLDKKLNSDWGLISKIYIDWAKGGK